MRGLGLQAGSWSSPPRQPPGPHEEGPSPPPPPVFASAGRRPWEAAARPQTGSEGFPAGASPTTLPRKSKFPLGSNIVAETLRPFFPEPRSDTEAVTSRDKVADNGRAAPPPFSSGGHGFQVFALPPRRPAVRSALKPTPPPPPPPTTGRTFNSAWVALHRPPGLSLASQTRFGEFGIRLFIIAGVSPVPSGPRALSAQRPLPEEPPGPPTPPFQPCLCPSCSAPGVPVNVTPQAGHFSPLFTVGRSVLCFPFVVQAATTTRRFLKCLYSLLDCSFLASHFTTGPLVPSTALSN